MICGEQVRMGRAALGWSVRDLSAAAKITANTVSRIENGSDAMGETLRRIEAALTEAGLILIPQDDHGGPGVRFKRKLGGD